MASYFIAIDSFETNPKFKKMLMKQNVKELAVTKKRIARLENKTFFSEHSHFVHLDDPSVVYINQIRDPIARVNSAYCYARDPTKKFGQSQNLSNKNTSLGQCIQQSSIKNCVRDYNLFIPIKYFCGNHHTCKNPNTHDAMKRTIANIDKFYLVVGVLEQFKKTLIVLEYLLPEYFAGAVNAYEEQEKQGKNVHEKCLAELKRVDDPEDPVYQKLKKHLHREYVLYSYVVSKLEQQYKNIENFVTMIETFCSKGGSLSSKIGSICNFKLN